MLWLLFIVCTGSIAAMGWMIFRIFPELADITVAEHRHFSFFGSRTIHILRYTKPTHVFQKYALRILEKTLRRCRWLVLKLDTSISRTLEYVQTKHRNERFSEVKQESAGVQPHSAGATVVIPSDVPRPPESGFHPTPAKRMSVQKTQQPRVSITRMRRSSEARDEIKNEDA